MTPMQEQYEQVKAKYPNVILLFRLGDFYEAFNDDAVTISRVLGITLTGRGKGETRTPMAGIPHHALKNYLPKLIDAGLKVAVADQMEEPMPGKLVERQVTKVLTPGTIVDEETLDSSKNNFISSVFLEELKESSTPIFNLVICDLSTGEFKAFLTTSPRILKIELEKIAPKEVLVPENQISSLKTIYSNNVEIQPDNNFKFENAYEVLSKQLGVQNLKGFGIEEKKGIISAAGALIQYLKDCQKTEIKHIKSIKLYTYDSHMQLDIETIRNLELFYPISGSDLSTTVYSVLNACQNPMGKRLLRNWLLTPLLDSEILQERFDSVEYFFQNRIKTNEIQDFLKNISDIERIVGKIGVGSANPKDLVALRFSLENTLNLLRSLYIEKDKLPSRLNALIEKIVGADPKENSDNNVADRIKEIISLVKQGIREDPPAIINEGGIIAKGYNSEVDELRSLSHDSKKILSEIQQREIQKTGISSLKISYNQVFGYYIEVTKTHINKVPDYYIRKQTLVNAERFITEELKTLEDKILSAEEKLDILERDLFIEIRNKLANFSNELLEVGKVIAEFDVLSNFGYLARENNYSKPVILKNKEKLELVNGRHIVVEHLKKDFIPNTTNFEKNSIIHILTGPNMSGKSTYIRQVALITLLAQIGSFVPAEKMQFSLIDRIFTRVGASDNLAHGESTFMVEMTETANILNNATNRSLVILDEVGRGTSTYDGVAIAWSIVEYLFNKIKCKTLFATHYHELIELENRYPGIENYNVNVIEKGSEILFQHKISKGSTNRSYGVHVAKLAGVPNDVLERANEILEKFEKNGASKEENSKTNSNVKSKDNKKTPVKPRKIHPEQLGLM
jgi:DNA mismatch repair protein MutS